MDQMTQQNATMVEESNAAGMTLAAEAGRLRDMIGQFRLDNMATRSAQALRAAGNEMTKRPVAGPGARAADPMTPRRRLAASLTATATAVADEWEEF
jgi:methyl-accepting chemotaxis protein